MMVVWNTYIFDWSLLRIYCLVFKLTSNQTAHSQKQII